MTASWRNAWSRGVGARLRPGPPGPLVSSLVVAAPVVAAAVFYVWTHVTAVRLGYALSTASEAHAALRAENHALRIRVATLKAPERLARLGRADLGLAPPTSAQVVQLEGARP